MGYSAVGDFQMRMDRLTTSFQNALAESQSLALGQDHNQIDTLHLLLALLQQTSSSVKDVLRRVASIFLNLKLPCTKRCQINRESSSPMATFRCHRSWGVY